MPADVVVTEIELTNFKKIDEVVLNLSSTNVLVGGNNSGKSSVLQGIHFGVCAAIAGRQIQRQAFTQSALLYCPARDFVSLRHGTAYTNQNEFSTLQITGRINNDSPLNYSVRIYRGRNDGNVGCERIGPSSSSAIIANHIDLFSIYVPGLAGVPQVEEYRSESIVRRGVAGGDANLYLRNVLYLIEKRERIDKLVSLMQKVFPGFGIQVTFDETVDVHIDVEVWHAGDNNRRCPIELAGTGVLQALQIFSYVTLFEPSLLLLDEPDAHLHPNNQAHLASTLRIVASETQSQVILSTHSRHLVESLQGGANFIWLKNGRINEQGTDIDRLPILLELGALDKIDYLADGNIKHAVLTEDQNVDMMRTLLECAGFDMSTTVIQTYASSSLLQAALTTAAFIKTARPAMKVIIHRDRDFMTDAEVNAVAKNIESCRAEPFITDYCDVESYFIQPGHLASILSVAEIDVVNWLDELATTHHNDLVYYFSEKRKAIKSKDDNNQTKVRQLLGRNIPLSAEKRVGKRMLAYANGDVHARFNTVVDFIQASDRLEPTALIKIANGC